MESYRLINNLINIDKIIKEDLKFKLTNYFEDNGLIGDNHHGSREGHGTKTVTASQYGKHN